MSDFLGKIIGVQGVDGTMEYLLWHRSESRVLIIQSAVPGAFCSGADLKVKRKRKKRCTCYT